jgi:hypothetical protein
MEQTKVPAPTCHKILTSLSHNVKPSTPRHEQDSNSQLCKLAQVQNTMNSKCHMTPVSNFVAKVVCCCHGY